MIKSLRKLVVIAAIATFAVISINPTSVTAGGDDRHEVRAELAGKTLASGHARYRDRMRGNVMEQRFSVEVEDAEPGVEMTVFVNGVQFGTIFTNKLGFGELQFRTAQFIDDPGDGTPIDTDFPRLQPGDFVEVGPISGTFELD